MKISIRQMDPKQFESSFATDDECLRFLSEQKWADGFVCRRCGHTNFCKGKTPYARRCTRCKQEESARANTIFHRCHIHLTEAFRIVYMVCHDPEVSSYEISRRIDLRQMTCWKLKAKLKECVKKKGEIDVMFNG
ncbi:MAG: transposase [bacterium]